MEEIQVSKSDSHDYGIIRAQLTALLENETDWIAGLANTSAYLNELLECINWVGFYLLKQGELVLGPFQGKVACTRIAIGKGVCGTAVKTMKTQRVSDVHAFKGHIACDSSSKSELVCPLVIGGKVIGVLDIDSPELDRFDQTDQINMEMVAKILSLFLEKTKPE